MNILKKCLFIALLYSAPSYCFDASLYAAHITYKAAIYLGKNIVETVATSNVAQNTALCAITATCVVVPWITYVASGEIIWPIFPGIPPLVDSYTRRTETSK